MSMKFISFNELNHIIQSNFLAGSSDYRHTTGDVTAINFSMLEY